MRAAFSLLFLSSLGFAADLIPIAEQNALVKSHCAMCHSDAARNGGLSLERFDAAKASPSLIAMMLAKLNTGAFGASGMAVAKGEDGPLKAAFAEESKGATEWSVERGAAIIASTVRTVGDESYRVIATCDSATKRGSLQVAWAPEPKNGTLTASVDGKQAVPYVIDVHEKMGNGTNSVSAGSNVLLNSPLPAQTLTIGGLFPGQSVTFPFAQLSTDARRGLSACFR